MIISLDLMIALPILALTLLLLFSGIYSAESGLGSLAVHQKSILQRYSGSQLIATEIARSHANLSSALSLAGYISRGLDVNASITQSTNVTLCNTGYTICRMLVIQNRSYFLVIK